MDAFIEFPEKPSLKKTLSSDFGRLSSIQHKVIQDVSKAHVESFNYVLREGLSRAVADIPPCEFALPNGDRVKLEIREALTACELSHPRIPTLGSPMISKNTIGVVTPQVYPAECRNRGTTYRGRLDVTVVWSVNGVHQDTIKKTVGEVPIMVKSQVCNIAKMSPAELVRRGEEAGEFGGYFIVNGNEKIIRNAHHDQEELSHSYDQTGTNMVLHYLTNGTVQVMFSYMKELFFMPVMMLLKALCDVSDHHIYSELIAGKEKDSFFKGCIINIDEEVAGFLLKHCICVHTESNLDKFNLILLMIRKLFAVAKGECAIESADNPMNHEILLAGHLYLMVLKEKLSGFLYSNKAKYRKESKVDRVCIQAQYRQLQPSTGNIMGPDIGHELFSGYW
ncbi:hypothetical protein MRX96_014109 [Rhipicephalus microplus]